MRNTFLFSKATALQKLTESPYRFAQLFRHGTLEVEVYKPVGTDTQQPHDMDELYVILSGNSQFYHEENTVEVTAGDCLCVPAFDSHYFFDFSDDFVTWVFFFGACSGAKE